MKLNDIYAHKENKNVIIISSFATELGHPGQKMIIVFENIMDIGGGMMGSSPSFNGYGTEEGIEREYDLLVDADDIKNYKEWDDIMDLVDKS